MQRLLFYLCALVKEKRTECRGEESPHDGNIFWDGELFSLRFSVFYVIFSLSVCHSQFNCICFIRCQCWLISRRMDEILQTDFVSMKLWSKKEPYPNVYFCPEWRFWSIYLIVSPFCLQIMLIVDLYWLPPRCQSLIRWLGVGYLIPPFLTLWDQYCYDLHSTDEDIWYTAYKIPPWISKIKAVVPGFRSREEQLILEAVLNPASFCLWICL